MVGVSPGGPGQGPKIFFQIFGPFPGAPGAHAHHFRIPLLPLHTLKFFPTFLPHFFHHLTQAHPTFRLTFILPSSRYSTPSLTSIQCPCPGEPGCILLMMIMIIILAAQYTAENNTARTRW